MSKQFKNDHTMRLVSVKGVTEKLYYRLRKEKLYTTYDIVKLIPKSYDEYDVKSIFDCIHKEAATISGQIASEPKVSDNRRFQLTTFDFLTEGIYLTVNFYNRPFLIGKIKNGTEILIKGILDFNKRTLKANLILNVNKSDTLKPQYKLKEVKDFEVTKIVNNIFEQNLVNIYETLPSDIVWKYNLVDRKTAFQLLHQPQDKEDIKKALVRFKYEEAYNEQKLIANTIVNKPPKHPVIPNLDWVKDKIKGLPYELTFDQKTVINDVFRDFKAPYQMHRILQADVGSGKSIVAFIAILGVISAGKQSAMMAPTESLALQLYETFKNLFPYVKSALLTGSTKNRKSLLRDLNSGKINALFGTHSLFSENVIYNDLGIVIIDEQHKFGTKARQDLVAKSTNANILYLSATPIPRTLAMTFYGQIEYSEIKEKPHSADILTEIIEYDIEIVIDLIKENQARGHQSFVVVHAITSIRCKYNIENAFEVLSPHFGNDLYVLHSKLATNKKETVFKDFRNNPQGVLLATSVIEVGIDCPNATQIFILDAHHFGLASLHQLRGRVGRANFRSYCYLLSEKTDLDRLDILTKTTDGFEIAEQDLKTRGPGQVLGLEQKGFVEYEFLDINTDINVIKSARKDVLKKYNLS